MTDLVDISQWLPRGVPVVSKYRLQHGDLDGKIEGTDKTKRITAAWVRDDTIARKLILSGFIDDFHLEYGVDLAELRNALYGHLNAKSNFSMFIIPGGDTRLSKSNAQIAYDEISKVLKPTNRRLVFHAIEATPPDNFRAEIMEIYTRAFELLVKATDEIAERFRGDKNILA